MQRKSADLTISDLVDDAVGVVYDHLDEVDAYQLSLTSKRFDLLALKHFRIKIQEYLAKYYFGKIEFDKAFNELPLSYVARLVSMLKQPINREEKRKQFLAWLTTEDVRSVRSFAFWQLAITIVLRDAGCHYINSASAKMFGSDDFNPEPQGDQNGYSVSINNDDQVAYIKEAIRAFKISQSIVIEACLEQNVFGKPHLQSIGWIYTYFSDRMNENVTGRESVAAHIRSLLEPTISGLNLKSHKPESPESADRLKNHMLSALQGLSERNPWLAIYFVDRLKKSSFRAEMGQHFEMDITNYGYNFIEEYISRLLFGIEDLSVIFEMAVILARLEVSNVNFKHACNLLRYFNVDIRDVLFVISNTDSFKLLMERIIKLYDPSINDSNELERLVRPHKYIHLACLLAYFAHNNVSYVNVKKIAEFYFTAMNKIMDIKKTNYLKEWENKLRNHFKSNNDVNLGKNVTELFELIALEAGKRFKNINKSIFSSPLVVETCMDILFNSSRTKVAVRHAYVRNYLKLLEGFVGLNNLKQLTPSINNNLRRIAQVIPEIVWTNDDLQAVVYSNRLGARSLTIYDNINFNVTFGGSDFVDTLIVQI